MKKNAFLAGCITFALSTHLSANNPLELEPVVVTIDRFPQQHIIYVGGNLGNGPWFWDDSPQGSTGGSVSPGSWPGPEPICAFLSAAGRPDGCTRTYIQQGPPQVGPGNRFIQPWQIDALDAASNSSILNLFIDTAGLALRNCYSDQSNDPASCESTYRTTLRNTCNIYASTARVARNDMTDRELCLSGVDEIDESMGIVASNRSIADWFGGVDVSLSVLIFDVDFGSIGPFVSSLDQYNRALVQSRDYTNCALWINAWDSGNCGSFPS